MGDWSAEPWGSDEAADWFYKFWKTKDMQLAINDIYNFDPEDENYESIRAAAHVVISFGSPYSWPHNCIEKREATINKAIFILERMIHPPDNRWTFLDMGGDIKEITKSVKIQIDALTILLSKI